MTEWSESQVLTFIKLVKERPAIYNTSREFYRPQYHRDEMFEQCQAALQKIGINISVKEIAKKWSNLKKSYRDEQKKMANPKKSMNYKPSLFYFKEMSFLDEAMDAKTYVSSQPQFKVDSNKGRLLSWLPVHLHKFTPPEWTDTSSEWSFSNWKKRKIDNAEYSETVDAKTHEAYEPKIEIDSGKGNTITRPQIILPKDPAYGSSESPSSAQNSISDKTKNKIDNVETVDAKTHVAYEPKIEIDSGKGNTITRPQIIFPKDPAYGSSESSSSAQNSISDKTKNKIDNVETADPDNYISLEPQIEIVIDEDNPISCSQIALPVEKADGLKESSSSPQKTFSDRNKGDDDGNGESLSKKDDTMSKDEEPPVEDMSLCDGCQINIINIVEEIGSEEKNLGDFLKRHGVLMRMTMNCPHCSAQCRQKGRFFRCDKTRVLDGKSVRCNFKCSIKRNSWITGTKLPFITLVKLITTWLTVFDPEHEFLRECLKLSPSIVARWSNMFQEICINSLVLQGVQVIGGSGKTVELGEADLGKDRNQIRKDIEGFWVLGAFERETKKVFLEAVHDLSAPTLLEVIERRIAAGTTIISSAWEGYNPLRNHPDYVHLVVNCKESFVDSQTGAHTQNIRRLWRGVRSIVPRSGAEHIEGYLAEFLWKREHELEHRVHNFLMEVGRQFDPNVDDDKE